jgi:3-mercaptopyruvate sulfurtransferase SseA
MTENGCYIIYVFYDGSMGEWAKDRSLPIETG